MINIGELIIEDYTKWKDKKYIFEKNNGVFEGITYGDFFEKAACFAEYLISQNMKNKKIMIFSENNTKWMIADLAILSYVGVSVGVSKEWKYDDIYHAISFLDIACVIYSDSKQDIMEKIKQDYPDLFYISLQRDFDEMIEYGKKIASQKGDIFYFEKKDADTCSKIVFTSGTTAFPNAVMLSLKNIFSGCNSLRRRCPFGEDDISYLFLPLSHTYGNIYNFIYSLVFGFKLYLCSGIMNMESELSEVNPTIFCAVPMVYRKIYDNNKDRLGEAFGNQMKYMFCGGAYFDEKIRKAYKDSGLNMMEAYALSETASSFSIEYPFDSDTKSVGTIFEDIDVKIFDPDENGVGEIMVSGDNVFLGYANNEALTKSSFTEDHYFLTGDLGYIRNKKLYITGRKKKIIIGENGESINYEKIQESIKSINSNINYVKVFIKNNVLTCYVYIFERDNSYDWKEFFDNFNKNHPKYQEIKEYKVFIDSFDTRLK